MMKLLSTVAFFGVAISIATSSFAENKFSVRAEGGLTGYGGAVLYEVNPYVSLALGYNGGQVNWKNSVKINNIDYNLKMNNDTSYFNALIHPWGTSDSLWARSFYTAVGLGYIGDNYDVDRYFVAGEKRPSQLNKFVPKSVAVDTKGYLDYSSTISPYLGIGISPQINKNWSAFAEIGAYYTGDAQIHITEINGINVQDLSQRTDYQLDDEEIFRWHPVAKLGFVYTF